ncbi:mobile mystery protein A [Antribacter sp. KLBMP9083]|uniref:Mobile mystery protein A n=2 Tax=Antribacter soli TaxID=2910976 RepID=A0AA41QCD3_9MICO|nr:mobile mystery protein A [Antribacter soli]
MTARPAGGWVRAIRSALGMSTTDLARRLGVTPVAVRKLEASERAGTARLDTLARAADAMGCDLVYAFVPRASLEEIVRDQAEKVAAEQLRRVETTMALEDQRVEDARERDRLRAERVRALTTSPHLWRELA